MKYTQGICNDGAAILRDGARMTTDEVIEKLNSIDKLESVLRFYADEHNNAGEPTINGYNHGRVYFDKGRAARKALNDFNKEAE